MKKYIVRFTLVGDDHDYRLDIIDWSVGHVVDKIFKHIDLGLMRKLTDLTFLEIKELPEGA